MVAQRRIQAAIELLAGEPRPNGAKTLVGGDGEWRVRTGDVRVVYEIHDDAAVSCGCRRPPPRHTNADSQVQASAGSAKDEGFIDIGTELAGQNLGMTDEQALQDWWAGLTPDQRGRAATIASGPAPRGMAIDDLTASMILAGLPTSRQIWTGQPEHLVEMLDDVAAFVTRQHRTL